MPSLQPFSKGKGGVYVPQIAGRFRRITVHQLAIAWWLYQSSHITLRQLRVYFAAHEMAERRPRKLKTSNISNQGQEKPLYTLDELARLLGCRPNRRTLNALLRDVKILGNLGLVKLGNHHIEFAASIEQIAVDDVSSFWTFFNQLPNSRRAVPVPRRTCRALVAGLGSATTGLTIALLIRSLFWHKERGYRTDGRTKCSWVAEVFGLSRRSVQLARTKLIKLGWLTPIEAEQWELNRWGQRYHINPEAAPGSKTKQPNAQSPTSKSDTGFAPLTSGDDTRFAPPYINKSSSSNEEFKTRLFPRKGDGVSISGSGLSRRGERAGGAHRPASALPQLLFQGGRVRVEDLKSDTWLRELHPRLKKKGLLPSGERGLRELFALAERCLRVAHNPCAMFVANLRAGRWHYTTCEDEDAARRRLSPPRSSAASKAPEVGPPKTPVKAVPLSGDVRVVLTCRRVAASGRTHLSAQRLARIQWGWTEQRWLQAEKELERSNKPKNQNFRGRPPEN